MLWTIWSIDEEGNSTLIGVATNAKKAKLMEDFLKKRCQDDVTFQICTIPSDVLIINKEEFYF